MHEDRPLAARLPRREQRRAHAGDDDVLTWPVSGAAHGDLLRVRNGRGRRGPRQARPSPTLAHLQDVGAPAPRRYIRAPTHGVHDMTV